MNALGMTPTVMVALSELTVARLLKLQLTPNENLDSIVLRCATPLQTPEPKVGQTGDSHQSPASRTGGKYTCDVLGLRLHAQTLPLLFGAVIDVFDDLAPDALEALARRYARKRKFLSVSKETIHPGRPDLPLVLTKSGWWISGNVGLRDVIRALEQLCAVTKLSFGVDIRFPPR